VLVEFLFLRRFFRAPRLIATVATIGIAQILLGVTLFLPRWIGKSNDFKLPNELSWSFHVGVTNFGGNEILVLIVVPIVLAALVAFFRFSAVGTALRATARAQTARRCSAFPCVVSKACCGRSSGYSRTSRSSCATE